MVRYFWGSILLWRVGSPLKEAALHTVLYPSRVFLIYECSYAGLGICSFALSLFALSLKIVQNKEWLWAILSGSSLTLIHLTPYRYSYHPTYLPFPSAQCEYLFWIRSGGNVSISFFLRRGGRGRSVHCTLYMEGRRRRGKELGLI